MSTRPDGRGPLDLRPVSLRTGVQRWAEGSVEISMGGTVVLCAATIDRDIPRWLRGQGRGWVTAEYAMLPRATTQRTSRESASGRVKGRTHEIQRLIGRSLRSVVDLKALADVVVTVDCDVLQADGGTRTASVTGGWVALQLALDVAVEKSLVRKIPRLDSLAAVSVGLVDGEARLDLCYAEDAVAQVDMNVVVDGTGRFVEVQGTAEGNPFSRDELDGMLDLALKGCQELMTHQQAALAAARG